MTIIKNIKEMKAAIENRINDRETPHIIDTLRVRCGKRAPQFYRVHSDGTPEKYIAKSDTQTLKRLAQNTYEKRLVSTARKEIAILDEGIRILSKCPDINDVYEQLPEAIKPYVYPNAVEDQFAQQWQNRRYSTNSMPIDCELVTSRGEHVRSKIELLIGENLIKAGIPYHYEPAFKTKDGEVIYPDFYILKKSTGQIIIWEHLGKMDDDKYRKRNLWKIEQYAKSGFVIGKNLIVTFESKETTISTNMIQTIIREILS
ncbi:MAG: hypothetical protein MJ057_01640 [Sphaerochaetaceae bacterium]|nr:hypothetical protein [Sphaerochaetaceae bacterium]